MFDLFTIHNSFLLSPSIDIKVSQCFCHFYKQSYLQRKMQILFDSFKIVTHTPTQVVFATTWDCQILMSYSVGSWNVLTWISWIEMTVWTGALSWWRNHPFWKKLETFYLNFILNWIRNLVWFTLWPFGTNSFCCMP